MSAVLEPCLRPRTTAKGPPRQPCGLTGRGTGAEHVGTHSFLGAMSHTFFVEAQDLYKHC